MVGVGVTIIGAGVVGLAVARELGFCSEQVLVLEKESAPGKGISSRNSEVVHAGIYYPEGSLKAALCVEGSAMLRAYCAKTGVPLKKIGKVIVAASRKEEQALEDLCRKGTANGARDLRMLSGKELKKREPNVRGVCALFSPHTGIIDSHRLVRSLEIQCLAQGAAILYRTTLFAVEKAASGFTCRARGPGGEPYSFASRVVINAAGLDADEVASLAGIDVDASGCRIYPVKGEYFRVGAAKQGLVSGLVYPVPKRNLMGLGVHATKDLSGSLRLGPNALPAKSRSYEVDPSHAQAFFESARQMLPFLEPADLAPDMAGIRPKIQRPGEPVKDFVVRHEAGQGLAGMINLIGIESPGLTSCLSLGRYVADMVRKSGLAS
ncbi:MAG: FAD-dependent oxidoreductase [Deltaproteobacteria bacterium]|jgi:L-2-hydroxyglutarate oxidase LhgO|nr:FAD-dependent oxidoreductase [Deltaproteobacteria bacterium]MDX9762638.1 FAD-dependent oxidoreductase [Desulfomonilia bacterium]